MPKIYQHSGTHLFLLFWKAYHAVMRYDQASISQSGFSSLTDFAVLEVNGLHRIGVKGCGR